MLLDKKTITNHYIPEINHYMSEIHKKVNSKVTEAVQQGLKYFLL